MEEKRSGRSLWVGGLLSGSGILLGLSSFRIQPLAVPLAAVLLLAGIVRITWRRMNWISGIALGLLSISHLLLCCAPGQLSVSGVLGIACPALLSAGIFSNRAARPLLVLYAYLPVAYFVCLLFDALGMLLEAGRVMELGEIYSKLLESAAYLLMGSQIAQYAKGILYRAVRPSAVGIACLALGSLLCMLPVLLLQASMLQVGEMWFAGLWGISFLLMGAGLFSLSLGLYFPENQKAIDTVHSHR